MAIKTGFSCWLAAAILGMSGFGWLCLAALAAGFVLLGFVMGKAALH